MVSATSICRRNHLCPLTQRLFWQQAHTLMEDDEQAIASFNAALACEPQNSRSLQGRAEAYRRLGRLEDALADVKALESAEPKLVGSLRTEIEQEAAEQVCPTTTCHDLTSASLSRLRNTLIVAAVFRLRRARRSKPCGEGRRHAESLKPLGRQRRRGSCGTCGGM